MLNRSAVLNKNSLGSDPRWIRKAHSDEEFDKICEKHIKEYTGSESSYCARIISNGEVNSWVFKGNNSCYGPLDTLLGMYFDRLGVGLHIRKDDEAKMEFKKWILGKFSPWRRMFHEPFEFIETPTFIKGFKLGPKTLEDMQKEKHPHSTVLLNFLIATRMVTQFPLHVDFWWKAVQLGSTRADAFFLARNFRLSDKGIFFTHIRDSGHYAFGGDIDIEKFVGGHPRKDTNQRGTVWAKKDLNWSGWPFDFGKEYWRTQEFDFLKGKNLFTDDEFKSIVMSQPIANQAKDLKKINKTKKKA